MNHSCHPTRTDRSPHWRVRAVAVFSTSTLLIASQLPLGAAGQQPVPAPQAPAPNTRCRVTGKVTSGTQALPGVALLIKSGDKLLAATSTDADGKFTILFSPSSTYHVTAELTAFGTTERDLTTGPLPCDSTLDLSLSLQPKSSLAPIAPEAPASIAATTAGQPPATAGAAAGTTGAPASTTPATGAAPNTRGGRGTPANQQSPQFSTLSVQADANGTQVADMTAEADLSKLLPPGFTLQSAQADAVAINGSGDALAVDRSAMNDRAGAIGRGEFDPATGQFAAGFGPAGGPGGAGGDQAGFGGAGGGGRGGGAGGARGGGPGGFGGFQLGGRGARGQSPYQGSFNYSYGGSSLDSTPLTIGREPDGTVTTIPGATSPFNRNNAGFTFGGPLKIPGVYADTNRRTNFQLNYTGNHTTTAASQTLTVPTDAERSGNFSSTGVTLINPVTGLPFPNNQVPVSPVAQQLLPFIPQANVLDQFGNQATTNNLVAQGITLNTSNSISLQLRQNLSPTVATGRGNQGGGGGRGGGGGGGGRGAAGGRGGRGLNINLTAQVQYRENGNQSFNAIPGLAGTSQSKSLTVPVSVNMSKGRTVQTFSLNVAHTTSSSTNNFSNSNDAAGAAGIQYPVAQNPFNYGVPNLSFTGFSSIRPAGASQRTDTRLKGTYNYSRTIGKHQLQIGGDYTDDRSSTLTNGNARGSFVYSGLYTLDGAQNVTGSGADFADFLLGMPQQATLQAGGLTRLHEKSFDASFNDNWQKGSKMTLSLGLRYELEMPYVETSGQMANFDATPDFSAVSVVCASSNPACANVLTGPYTGGFPAGLLNADTNNIGPRLGIVYRLARNTLLRGGYTITYNNTLPAIARQLVGQPPFSETVTNVGTIASPLLTTTALLQNQQATTNTFGVDKAYALGMIQTWNATFTRDLTRNITFLFGYTGTKGTDLDLQRAPNRNADGTLRIPTAQPFIWESSEGKSLGNVLNLGLNRRYAGGFSLGGTYTYQESKDNSHLGGGGSSVAQNDLDIASEYATSSFVQKHNLGANLTWELPFGANRKWLSDQGFWSALVGEWSMTLNFSAHSGSPFTATVPGSASSIASNTNGALRANIDPNAVLQLSDPSLGQFFNTTAFSQPAFGTFGDSPRNVIFGPGGHVVNASFSRDMRLGGNKALSLQINVNNLLNTIQWMSIDTNVLSNTFGQVTRLGSMRTLTASLRFRF
jgi:hypothetical protein